MPDPELEAMSQVHEALADLEQSARARVIRWISEKFDIEVIAASKGGSASDNDQPSGSHFENSHGKSFTSSLATHIKAKGGEGNQVQRFLATSDWLRCRGEGLTSSAVAKALQSNHQSRLANPADSLNKNVAKGFCEKTKDGFFITPEGLKALGNT